MGIAFYKNVPFFCTFFSKYPLQRTSCFYLIFNLLYLLCNLNILNYENMAKGLCTFLSKTFWLSLLLGTVSINSHAEELYPWQLAGDSLLLFKGTTYRYTVDTPENQGLVSTLPTVTELKNN